MSALCGVPDCHIELTHIHGTGGAAVPTMHIPNAEPTQEQYRGHVAPELMIEIDALRAEVEMLKRHLGNLLAIVHRDCGNHQARVGTDQAINDAYLILAAFRGTEADRKERQEEYLLRAQVAEERAIEERDRAEGLLAAATAIPSIRPNCGCYTGQHPHEDGA